MSKIVAIRFTLTSGDVDFYEEEILGTKPGYLKSFQVQENQDSNPNITYNSDTWKAIEITFFEKWQTTKAKIDQVIDEKVEMTLYYDYAYAGTGNPVSVVYMPEGNTKTYKYYGGELAASVDHRLIFLQSS